MTNKSGYYKKIKRQQLQNIMEPLKNNYFRMARTGKVKDFSETCIRVSNQTQAHFCCIGKQMQIEGSFWAQPWIEGKSSEQIKTMPWKWPQQQWFSRFLSQAQHVFRVKLLMPPKALERLLKTVQHRTLQEQAVRQAGDAEMSRPYPQQQNSAVGCHKAHKLGCQYLSLTPTCGHLVPLPWLIRRGATSFTHTHTSHIFSYRIRAAFFSAGSITGTSMWFPVLQNMICQQT